MLLVDPYPQFLPFKNKHRSETAVLIATGPTMRDYVPPTNDELCYVGVNRAPIWFKKAELDYWFFSDHWPLEDFEPWPLAGFNPTFDEPWERPHDMPHEERDFGPDDELRKRKSLLLFDQIKVKRNKFGGTMHLGESSVKKISTHYSFCDSFESNISLHPMKHGSIVFPAIQFILYAGFTKIYLVGCDVTEGYECLFELWKQFQMFKKQHYPDVEVYAIASQNLKKVGMEVL